MSAISATPSQPLQCFSFTPSASMRTDEQLRPLFLQILKQNLTSYLMGTSSAFRIPENMDLQIADKTIADKFKAIAVEFNQGLYATQLQAPAHGIHPEAWVCDITTAGLLLLDQLVVIDMFPVVPPQSMAPYIQCAPEQLSCYEYAFCQLEDAEALFSEYGMLLDSLSEWGYQQVQHAKAGDLVLYLNKGEPTHAGIYRNGEIVESKWGNQRPLVYQHNLNDVPKGYGNKVMFFRPPQKNQSNPCQQ